MHPAETTLSASQIRHTAAFVCWLLVCIFLLYLPLSLHPTTHLLDDGDAYQGATVLGWVARQLANDPSSLFDMNAYYPHPKGLVYQEHLIPHGAVAALMGALGIEIVPALNAIVAMTLLAIALSVRLWVRELGGTELAGTIAGTIAALTTFTLAEASRIQLLSFQWTPLALFFLHRFFSTRSILASWGFAASLVLQALSSQYYLISSPLFFGPVLVGYAYLFPERRNLRDVARLGLPLLVLGTLLVPVELQYLESFTRYEFNRPMSPGTDLARYVVPPPDNYLYGHLFGSSRTLSGAHMHFIGYLASALAVYGLVSLWTLGADTSSGRTYRWYCRAFAVLGSFFAVLSAGSDIVVAGTRLGPGPFRFLYEYVPLFDYTRVPDRLSVYFTLALALLAGRGASALARRFETRSRKGLVLAVLFVALPAEHARRWAFVRPVPTAAVTPEVYRWLGDQAGRGAVADLPVWPYYRIRYSVVDAFYSNLHGRPVPFGKPSFFPPAFELLHWELRDFPDARSIALLRGLGFEFAIVHPKRWTEQRNLHLRRLSKRRNELPLIERFEDATDPLSEHYALGGERVHRIVAAPEAPALPPCDCVEIDRRTFTLDANGANPPALAIDGDRLTKWTTPGGQQEGHFFEISFDRPRRPVRVEIEMAFPFGEFARHLEMNGFLGQRGHRVIQLEDVAYKLTLLRQLVEDPTQARLRYDIEPMTMDRLRLFIDRTERATSGWSIAEIHVYEQRSN